MSVTSTSVGGGKKRGGKGVKKKLQEVNEVKPSKYATRVQPVIDSALRARLTAPERKPSKKV